jgi:hypothetical protein
VSERPHLTLLAGTFLKSGAVWQRIDVARYYELKDGKDPQALRREKRNQEEQTLNTVLLPR